MGMISDSDRQIIIKELQRMKDKVTILNFSQRLECQFCQPTEDLLKEVAALSDLLKLEVHNFIEEKDLADKYKIDKIPATIINGNKDYGIRFFGVPSGYEFASLLEAIIDVSNGNTDLSESSIKKLAEIKDQIHIQVFVTPPCPYCQRAVRTAHKLAIVSDNIIADMIEVTEFPQLGQKYQVMAVPKIVINEKTSFEGAVPEEQFVDKVVEASG